MKILIPDKVSPPLNIERKVFGEHVDIIAPCVTSSGAISDDIWSSADAVLAWHDLYYSEELLSKLSSCKVIVRVGVGFDNVDLEAAARRGIRVCNVPDYGTSDVANHTIALYLAISRKLTQFNEQLRQSKSYWGWGAAGELHRITGQTFGIIGLGRIGTAVSLRALSLGLKVIFYDPYKEDGYDKALNIRRCYSLEEFLASADVISFHAPLTKETSGMANEKFFELVKPGALLINTARGGIVPLSSLETGLRQQRIGAAALDVLEQEPLPEEHPLIKAWQAGESWIAHRLLLTPHAAVDAVEVLEEMRRKAAETAFLYLNSGELRNCVNLQFLGQNNK